MKQCRRCEKIQPLDNYWKHGRSKDGLNDRCKSCVRNLRKYSGLMRIGAKV